MVFVLLTSVVLVQASRKEPANLFTTRVADAFPDSILLLHLDESTGATTFEDDSGNNNDGFCSGDSCPTAGVAGKFGTALSFDGMDDYVGIGTPVPPALQIQNEISLEAWIYVTSYPAYNTVGTIVGCQYDQNGSGYAIHLDGRENPEGQPSPPGHIHFQIGDGSWHSTHVNAQVPLNQWVQIVAVRKANEDARVYYNGVQQPSTSLPWDGSIIYSGSDLALGRQADFYDRYFTGLIDEVAIYDQALSAEEVEILYRGGPLEDGVMLVPSTQSGQGGRGQTLVYEQRLYNFTDPSDTYSLALARTPGIPALG